MTRRSSGSDCRSEPKKHKQWLRRNDEVPLFAPTPAHIDAALPHEASNLATPTPLPKYTLDLTAAPTPRLTTTSPPTSISRPYRHFSGNPEDIMATGTNLMQQFLNSKRAAGGTSSRSELTNTSAQQQNSSSTTGGLFGSSTPQNQTQNAPSNTGGLFGGTNTTQQSQGTTGSLFGGNTASTPQNQGAGGLFGNTTQQAQPQPSGGLFGGSSTNAQQNTGSLFGAGNTNTQQQSTGGIFGSNNNTATTQQNRPAGNLFGASGNTNIIGGAAPNMFSQTIQQPAANATSSLFGGSTLGATTSTTTAAQAARQAPSLLSATQHNQMNQAAPFGRLSMGQAAAAPTTVGAAKVDYSQLLPTTRFEDCVDSVKAELEAVDKMIQQQESWARQIEAFLPKHEEDINSLGPDVDFIKSKAEDVEQALAADAQGVEAQRRNTEKDLKDAQRNQRIITNLTLPTGWQYPNIGSGGFGGVYGSQQQQGPPGSEGDEYDTDLIGNYFVPMAAELQSMMNAYANNLSEIENHMRVIESSAVSQAQQLAQRKAGTSGANTSSSDDTVRELASTLRGFEESILGVAGVVGECREGVNQLVLGRLGGMP